MEPEPNKEPNDFLSQARKFWASLPNAKRVALVLLCALGVACAIALSALGNRERLVPLYTGMEPADAAAVVQKLEAAQIPFELAASGTTILVPEDRLHKLRLEMAASGLPKGNSVGFELFDKSQFGATEFEQQVNLRRALEGELSRTIATVRGVSGARVHLVLPKNNAFVARKELASASVVVSLENPDLFGKKEVAAVVHLVSAAVPGLGKNRVSVVSTEGVTLHRPSQDGSTASGSDDLSEDAQALSTQLEAKAIAQLERVVGPGGADVRVTVTLDPSTKEQTKEVYQPEKTALRSEQQSEEDIRSQSPGALGIPGARTNMPDADGGSQTQASGAQNLDTTTRRSHTRNFEIDRTVEKVHTPAGTVARLSVAVLLNGTWQKQKSGPDVFVPRPQAEVDQLAQVVRQAVGYDELRGDSITVSAAQFARDPHFSEAIATPVLPLYQQPKVLLGALAALVLATLLTILLVWRRRKKARKQAEEAAKQKALEGGLSQGLHHLGESTGGGFGENTPELESAATEKLLSESQEHIAELREKALEIAAKDPATTAVVLRALLESDRSEEERAA